MSLSIAPGAYGIDTVHSQLGFSVKHLGISNIRGTFDRYTGELSVGASLADTVVTIEAEMASINSGNSMRDEHLLGPDFLDAGSFPTMLFRSTDISVEGNEYTVTGDLTVRGKTLPTVLDVSYNGSATFPLDGSTHHGFTATATITATDFGFSYPVPLISDEVSLVFEVQFVDPAASDD
jgi:polyisoprenoid-binding protein YceI